MCCFAASFSTYYHTHLGFHLTLVLRHLLLLHEIPQASFASPLPAFAKPSHNQDSTSMAPTSPPPCPLPLQDIEDAASASAASASASFGSVAILDSCTGCISCRVLAPDIFLEARKASADPTVFTEVAGRPLKSLEEAQQVREAIMACPVHAIKWMKRPRELKVHPLTEGYPKPVSGKGEKENVYLAGVPSKKLFGGASYLILGGGSGKDRNMLIDTPDCDEALVQFLKKRGGLEYILFTHIDHIACHREWKQAFPDVQRVMHADDFSEETSEFEIKLQGSGENSSSSNSSSSSSAPLVCSLPGWEGELQLIHGPGHTPGSIYIIYKDTYLFTGDSLHFSRVEGHLVGFRLQCWESWSRQQSSWQQLLRRPFSFLHVLPGHGEPHRFASVAEAHVSLEACLTWAKKLPDGYTPMGRFRLWAMMRTTSKRRWLRWVVDNMVLPSGSKLAIPLYSQEGGKEEGRKGFREVSSSGAVVVMVGVVSMLVGVGVGLIAAGVGGGGGRGGRRGGGRR